MNEDRMPDVGQQHEHGVAVTVEQLARIRAEILRQTRNPLQPQTAHDHARLEAAQAKRDRRNARRATN